MEPIRIIIVEDFHAETENVLRELDDADFNYVNEVVKNEDGFRTALRSFRPDVILSPYSLSGTNAVKLLSLARKSGVDAPFILLAFDLSEDIAIDLLGAGIEDYVLRSTLKRLPVAIRKALQRYKTQYELILSEAKLRQSEASLRQAQKIAMVGSWEWDLDKDEVVCSDEMFRIYESNDRPFTLQQAQGFVHPKDKERVASLMVKGLSGGFVPVVEYTIIAGNGTVKEVRANAELVTDSKGKVIKVIGTLQDITERKKIELELLKSQSLLALGEEISNSGTFELDITNGRTTWSPNFYRITGIDSQKRISGNYFLSCVHPDDRKAYSATIAESLSSGIGHEFIYRIIRPDTGQVVHLQANGRRIHGEDNVVRWIGSVLDISDRIHNQVELERSKASLVEAQKIAKVGSWEWEVGTEKVDWSDEMFRIYETERRNITLTDVKSFIHPEDRERVEMITSRDLNEDITAAIEYRLLLESGTVKHVISSAKQIKDNSGKVVRLIGTLQDVTDQVRVNQEQEAHRIQRELTVRASHIGVWHWNLSESRLVWDERCFEIFGLATTEPLDTTRFLQSVHPDDTEMVQRSIQHSMASGEYKTEYRIVVDGNVKYIHAQGRTTFNDKGQPIRMDGIILDMTERHEMEMALRQSEQLFRDMAESITEVFWLTDWNLNEVLYVSPRYETLYGMPVESLYEDSSSWSKAIHPEDLERATSQFRKLALTGQYDEEYRLLMKDGTVKWVRDRSFPVYNADGSVSRVAGITEEITHQKKTQESIETLSLVASETTNGVLIQNAEGKITWANRGFTEITGYTSDEVMGKEPWSFLSSEETDQKLVSDTYRKMKEGATYTSENSLIRKDGKQVWVQVAFTPILDENGALKNMVSIGVDISKQKEIENMQRNMLADLESRVDERTSQLEATNIELRNEAWAKQRLSDELYHKNLDLKDSLIYAKRIQDAIIPKEEHLSQSFEEAFVLFLPRDIVSGDFYWHFKRQNLTYFAVIDCTGHGVPGALMSMIGNELMNQVIIQKKLSEPSKILKSLDKLMIRTLRQKQDGNMRDGMDVSLCVFNHDTDTLQFAGALGSLYLLQNGTLNVFNGNRHSIGGHLEEVQKEFDTHTIKLSKGDTIYLTTDGYIDQFGGRDGKKLMKKRFEKLLLAIGELPLKKQKSSLRQKFNDWKGLHDQVDDILVTGLRY